MKRCLKTMLAMLLALTFVIGIAGCTSKETANDGEVTLKWILGGAGKQSDSEEVWAAFNEKLQEYMPGTTVEFEVIPMAEYAEKWKLFAASGEKIDIAWFGWMLNLEQEARAGSIMPLTELVDKHAPDLKGIMEDWVWDTTRIDGELYAIPNYQMMVSRPVVLRTPKKLADKYLDKERLVKVWSEWSSSKELKEIPDEFFDVIEEYLLKLKDAGELGLGISPEVFSGWLSPVNGSTFYNYGVITKENDKVVVKDVTDYQLNYYKRINELYKKGLIRRDALTVKDHTPDIGREGGYTMWAHQYDDFTPAAEQAKYGMEIEYIIRDNAKSSRYYKAGGTNTAIFSTSKNPERAMELLELINTEKGKELYNLLTFGLEGKHYEVKGENSIETLGYVGTPTMDSAYGIPSYVVGNTFNAFETQADVPGYNQYVRDVLHVESEPNLLQGFVFNSDPIKTEKAQIDSSLAEYAGLTTGAYNNYEELWKQKREKLKNSGVEKVLKEVQSQLDKWQNK